MPSLWIALGSALGFLGVALGAFGAHALKDRLDERALQNYQTATLYLFVHALGLLIFGLWSIFLESKSVAPSPWIGWAFFLGSVIFSGSLYVLSITGMRWLGAITPLGGLAFLAAWAGFFIQAYRFSTAGNP
jgi:uncharacterized membrane protein YgdD (TMEM256/DUF423 family)